MKNNNPKRMPFRGIFILVLLSVMPGFSGLCAGSPLPGQTVSQQVVRTISGTVTDETGQPLPGVSIAVKGTATGTITSADGNYSLTNVPGDATLVFSFIGMKTQQLPVSGKTQLNVVMQESTIGIGEVVAVGYGTQKKENVVGSVTSLAGDEIESVCAGDVTTAIAGRLPGTVVMQGSGEPGKNAAKILVRGRTTLGDDEDNTAPLVVIDGVPGRSLEEIDPSDIAGISVLKDAAASIYGSTAANGVILVTTRKGDSGKPRVTYQFYQGFMTATKLPDVATAWEYAQYISDYQDYEGVSRLYSDTDIELFKNGKDPWEHPQTDWMDDLVRDWASTARHNLSISGAGNKMKYYVSFGYKTENAFYEQASTKYNQYNLRTRLDIPVTDWLETSVGYAGFLTARKYPTTDTYNLIGWATLCLPTEPSFWPTGEPGPDFEGGVNPVVNSSFAAGYDKQDNYKNQVTFRGSVKPPMIKGLSIDGMYSFDMNNQYNKTFKKPWTLYYADWTTAVRNADGYVESVELTPEQVGLDSPELTEAFYRHQRKLWNVSLSYSRTVKGHTFSVFGAFEQLDEKTNQFDAYRKYFISDLVQILDAGGEAEKTNSGYMNIYGRESWIGRLDYNYREKYMAEIIFRRDGSLKFPSSDRWGNFPGVLLGWRASEEKFWQEQLFFINYFKLRASYGKIGMDPGDPFQYINKYSLGTGMTLGEDKDVTTKIYQDGVANTHITWEKQETWNVGFDSQFNKGMFRLNADLFRNKRSDILTPRNASVPDYTGLSLPDENIAVVKNKGFEIEAGFHKKVNADFTLDVSGNISWNRNKVVYQDEPATVVPWQTTTGHPYGVDLVYRAIGIFHSQEELDAYPHWSDAKPGDVIFEDVSGDGTITSDDKILLDKTDAPGIFYGIKIDAGYRNWSLSLLFQGQGTYYKASVSGNRGVGQNVYKWMATDYWTPENSSSDKARPFHRSDQYWSYLSNMSTYWYDNMAYCRLKNAVLSYTIPQRLITKAGISGASVFVSGNNLFMIWAKNKKYDPEVGDPESYPSMKTIAAGLKVTF